MLKERIESFSNAENLYRMGMIYKKQGKSKQAAEMFHLALKDYTYCPRRLRKMHRRWAFLSRLALLTVNNRT
jgi:tetratricopeptide (TPR) repeat protein